MAIVGPGRLGQAIGRLLAEAGVPILYVAARRRSAARRAVRFIGAGRPIELDSLELTEASVVLLTTSDGALAEVAARLARLPGSWRGCVALHTCGSLAADVLRPLARRGTSVGSLHPFQTIPSPRAGVRDLLGCFWGVEGDKRAQEVARKLVKALRGVPFQVRSNRKVLYHLAAFLSCPMIVTLMDRSERLLRRCGVPATVVRPMLAQFVSATARNFEALGGRRALTGPAARGDWTSIDRHLGALKRYAREVKPVYEELLRAMLRLAGRRLPRRLSRELGR